MELCDAVILRNRYGRYNSHGLLCPRGVAVCLEDAAFWVAAR